MRITRHIESERAGREEVVMHEYAFGRAGDGPAGDIAARPRYT